MRVLKPWTHITHIREQRWLIQRSIEKLRCIFQQGGGKDGHLDFKVRPLGTDVGIESLNKASLEATGRRGGMLVVDMNTDGGFGGTSPGATRTTKTPDQFETSDSRNSRIRRGRGKGVHNVTVRQGLLELFEIDRDLLEFVDVAGFKVLEHAIGG